MGQSTCQFCNQPIIFADTPAGVKALDTGSETGWVTDGQGTMQAGNVKAKPVQVRKLHRCPRKT